MDFIETCRKFIEIDSTPGMGTREIAQFAAELCRKAGLYVELQDESHNGIDQANVIARPIESRPQNELLLQTHLDTGDPGAYALWTKTGANPFNASIYQDTLYGLGSANTKLDFLCKLEAVRRIQSKLGSGEWRLPWVLAGTYGEELGMPGAIKLIRKKKISARAALIGEPTGLGLVSAGKGFAGVEIEIPFSDDEKDFRTQHDLSDGTTTQSRIFVGKAAQSIVPDIGENAVLKLLDYLAKLPEGLVIMEIEGGISYNTVPAHAVLEVDMVGDLRESIASKITRIMKAIGEVERRFQAFPDPAFNPPGPSLNIGLVRTYEDFVKICGCCRLPPSVSDEVYEEWMEILRSACHDVGAVFRVTDYKQPFRTPSSDSLIRVCREQLELMGRCSDFGAQSAANEANVFSRLGVSCVVFGPGQGVGNAHAPNENVKIEELNDAIRFYEGVLEKACL